MRAPRRYGATLLCVLVALSWSHSALSTGKKTPEPEQPVATSESNSESEAKARSSSESESAAKASTSTASTVKKCSFSFC